MNSLQTYTFSKHGWGSLDLELDAPSKQVYSSTLPESIPFKIEGLENDSSKPIELIHFFEWQKIQYTYLIDEKSQYRAPIELRINDRVVNKSKIRNGNHLLSGQFSFDDEIGETRIEIRDADSRLIFGLETEVFPQKMDYKSDYKAMMADISLIIQNLAYDTLKDTFRKSKARLSGQATQNEWWNILDALFEQLILNLGVIKRQPKHEIKTSEKVLPVEKIKQASKHSFNWFRKNMQYSNQNAQGIKVAKNHFFTHALSSKKYITYDTYENRFIAWAIKDIIEQLRKYKTYTEQSQGGLNFTPLLNRMKEYQSRLQSILREDPFNEAGEFEKRSHFSTSLTRGAGYRDFMHIYLLLARGLEIANNDIFKIEQKNISTLYEYWCFLKLVQILKEQNASEIDYQDLIKFKANKFHVELAKGEPSKVSFKKLGTEESTTIYFNKEFIKGTGKVFTYNQKPDYAIEFKKIGFDKPFWYLFDAKYRFDEQSESENNTYNVPQDAIGQLHRYRDAILHTELTNSTYRGAIKNLGGIILYPYPLQENEFIKNDYFKSIKEVNIGALPFLPSKTGLVSELLNTLINRMPAEHFEQFIEMDRSEYEQQRNLWKDWVTISVIPKENQEERWDFIQEKSIYHVPFVNKSHSKLYMTKKILLCKSGTTEAYLYDVKEWEILTDKELKEKGTTWNHRANKYVAFHLVKNGKQINTPDKLSPMKFRYATLEGLNRYLNSPLKKKGYFYLTNPDAARLYEELSCLGIKFDLSWGNKENDPSLVEFTIGTFKILSSDNFPSLYFEIGNEYVHLYKVLENINKFLKKQD